MLAREGPCGIARRSGQGRCLLRPPLPLGPGSTSEEGNMFMRTGPLGTAIGCLCAQRVARRPRQTLAWRSLLGTALLSLGLLALDGNIGAAYASNPPPTVSKVKPSSGPGTGGTRVTIQGP